MIRTEAEAARARIPTRYACATCRRPLADHSDPDMRRCLSGLPRDAAGNAVRHYERTGVERSHRVLWAGRGGGGEPVLAEEPWTVLIDVDTPPGRLLADLPGLGPEERVAVRSAVEELLRTVLDWP